MERVAQGRSAISPSSSAAIEGCLVRLRPIQEEDLPLVLEWRNSVEVRKYLLNDQPIPLEAHRQWFESLEKDNRRRVFLIVSREDRPLGLVQLFAIDRENGHAEWGFYVADPELRRAGFGPEVEYLILCCAFDELGLQRVYCHTLASNRAVLALHERFGFQQEGVLRMHVRRGNQYEDLVVMGILHEEFEQVRPRLVTILRGIADRQGGQQP